MRVKIKDTIYDADKEPIMLLLTAQDRLNIIGMHPDASFFCVYPNNIDQAEIDDFVKMKPDTVETSSNT